ncbi:MAG TPA: FAD-binding oxidoreductase [Ktedonobacteraceae bacterium]
MFDTTINPSSLQDFKTHLHGELIVPGDDAYDSARKVWNGMIDKYPAAIARCADVADVLRSVEFARSQQLVVAVRSGGHSFPGHSTCDGGLVIDLSRMKTIQVDPGKRTARVQAGITLGECTREMQKFGLAIPVGTASETGLAGLTLGGGLGWLMGKYGLTMDSLLAVEMVTADGRVLRASSDEHPDLFWAVRGGGGNFGIVTSFEFRLHPVETLLAGLVFYPMDRTLEVLQRYREFSHTTPDELTAYAGLLTMPNGIAAAAIGLCYCGPLEEGERLIAPIRTLGSPLADMIRPMSYLELISMLDAVVPRGHSYYGKAHSLKQLDDEAFQIMFNYSAKRTTPVEMISLQHVHGAVSRIDQTETAFALREEHYAFLIQTRWSEEETTDQADAHVDWTRRLWAEIEPFATAETYANYLEDEGEPKVRTSYGANYERLARVKNTYDPTNFFHLNQNIKPTREKL